MLQIVIMKLLVLPKKCNKYEMPHIKLKQERLKELCGEGQTTLESKVKSE